MVGFLLASEASSDSLLVCGRKKESQDSWEGW